MKKFIFIFLTVLFPLVHAEEPIDSLLYKAISPTTDFSIRELARLFPGLLFKSGGYFSEGMKVSDTIEAHDKNGNLLFVVHPMDDNHKIRSIEIKSKSIGTPNGTKIGDLYGEVEQKAGSMKCTAGFEEMSGKSLCNAGQEFVYVFDSGSYKGPDGTVPPMEILRNCRLTGYFWKPQAPAKRERGKEKPLKKM